MAYHLKISSPLETHTKKATCEEVKCGHFLEGWTTILDERSTVGGKHGRLLRGAYRGQFTETKDSSGATVFSFQPGTPCMQRARHRVKLDRPSLYITGQSGNLGLASADEYTDKFNLIAERFNNG